MDFKEAQYLKEGFRTTKTFKTIMDASIDAMKKKGWNGDNPLGEASELFRPMFEELYLNGCVQGVNGTRKQILKMIDDFDFSNTIRMNSNLGASKTQDRIKKGLKDAINGSKE